jgi:myosin heavy subunit
MTTCEEDDERQAVADLILLEDVSIPAIVQNLRSRYVSVPSILTPLFCILKISGKIYTYIGVVFPVA